MRLLAFGEILLRLSPPASELLLQTPKLDVWIGGAEANVATALARLGHQTALASAVPDNELGRGAVAALRGHGVNVSSVALTGRRMGLYFIESATGSRAAEAIYDRAGSSFAEAADDAWDWDALLGGVERLHLSGIVPALGEGPARHAQAAVRAAKERGVAVSFDVNHRAKLWRGRGVDPWPVLLPLAEAADTLFAGPWDLAGLLGRAEEDGDLARIAFAELPRLELLAWTERRSDGAGGWTLTARAASRDTSVELAPAVIGGAVDRIGSGDAFVAGVLHATSNGADLRGAAAAGLALAVLKHSLPGDASLFRRSDLDARLAGDSGVVR